MNSLYLKLKKLLRVLIPKASSFSINQKRKALFLRFLKRKKKSKVPKQRTYKRGNGLSSGEKLVNRINVYRERVGKSGGGGASNVRQLMSGGANSKMLMSHQARLANNLRRATGAKIKTPKQRMREIKARDYMDKFLGSLTHFEREHLKKAMEDALFGKGYAKAANVKFQELIELYIEMVGEHLIESTGEWMYFTFNSGWIVFGKYHIPTKRLYLTLKFGKKLYMFPNVVLTRLRVLVAMGGVYMWDYFGKKFSLNPKHWIRKRDRI